VPKTELPNLQHCLGVAVPAATLSFLNEAVRWSAHGTRVPPATRAVAGWGA